MRIATKNTEGWVYLRSVVLFLGCAATVRAPQGPTRNEAGAMVTGVKNYDQHFSQAVEGETELRTLDERRQAWQKPLGLALGLADGFTEADEVKAVAALRHAVIKAGSRLELTIRPLPRAVPGQPIEHAELKYQGAAIAPHPRLILDTLVATIDRLLLLSANMERLRSDLDHLLVESKPLVEDALHVFPEPQVRAAVVTELQARDKVLREIATRAQTDQQSLHDLVQAFLSTINKS